MSLPGDRSGGFGDRPDTGSPASSLGSAGRSYSGADMGRGSGDDSPRYQQSPVDFGSDGNYQQFASTRDVTQQPLFARVFGENYVTYPGGNTQTVAARQFGRYLDPNPVRTGFGKLFGGAEGEMTFAGPRTARVQPQTLGGGIATMAGSAMLPGLGFLDRMARTSYAPGPVPEGMEPGRQGILGGLTSAVEGFTGVPLDQTAEGASSLVDRARQGISSFFSPQEEQVIEDKMTPQLRPPFLNRTNVSDQITTLTSGAPPYSKIQEGRPDQFDQKADDLERRNQEALEGYNPIPTPEEEFLLMQQYLQPRL